MERILQLSLVQGAVPVAMLLLGALALAFLLIRRRARWGWLLAAVALSVAAVFALAWAAVYLWSWWAEPLPNPVVWWAALLLVALTLGVLRVLPARRAHRAASDAGHPPGGLLPPRRPAPRRPGTRRPGALRSGALAVLATAVLLGVGLVQINAYFGAYPTVGSLVAAGPAPLSGLSTNSALDGTSGFLATAVSADWVPPAGLPAQGEVRSAPIPGTVSGFTGRNALIYLPPAYQAVPRPLLPVLVLVAGQPGSPESWLSSSTLIAELDAFAAGHGGLAPVVVIPDPNGADNANTMCMNSALGQVDTYLATDLPAWVSSELDVDTNPAHWAVGGFSYGGTCALQLVTRHPELFQSFVAVAPEREPAVAADRQDTIAAAFHGDTAAFDAVVPLTLLAEHRYPTVQGWFAAGSDDALYTANVAALAAATTAAGILTTTHSYPGGHSWTVVNAGLPAMLAFLGGRLGLS